MSTRMVFDLEAGGRLRIDPARVESVAEESVRSRAGEKLLAEIAMRSGVQYRVLDPERTVMCQIAEAMEGTESLASRIASVLESLSVREA